MNQIPISDDGDVREKQIVGDVLSLLINSLAFIVMHVKQGWIFFFFATWKKKKEIEWAVMNAAAGVNKRTDILFCSAPLSRGQPIIYPDNCVVLKHR